MGIINDRLAAIVRRAEDLAPIGDRVRAILWTGNKERALAGTDAQGRPFRPLAPSTLRRRKGSGPPLAPEGADARIVTGYVVVVSAASGRLTATGSWPDVPWVEYAAQQGRDCYGFRQIDVDKVRATLRGHMTGDR